MGGRGNNIYILMSDARLTPKTPPSWRAAATRRPPSAPGDRLCTGLPARMRCRPGRLRCSWCSTGPRRCCGSGPARPPLGEPLPPDARGQPLVLGCVPGLPAWMRCRPGRPRCSWCSARARRRCSWTAPAGRAGAARIEDSPPLGEPLHPAPAPGGSVVRRNCRRG